MILTAAQKGKSRAQAPEMTPKRSSKAIVSRLSLGFESASDADTNSDSDASTSCSSSSGSESDSEEEISSDYMNSLLEKARQNAREKKKAVVALPGGEGEEEEVIRLEVEPETYVLSPSLQYTMVLKQLQISPKLPTLDPGSLPPAYIVPGDSRKAGPSKIRDPEVERTEKMSASLTAPAAPAPPREPLTKKERKAVCLALNTTQCPSKFILRHFGS